MLMNTYSRFPVTFVRGYGSYLWDEQGKMYLDFASGIGVNSVGHAHPLWVEAVSSQAASLSHVSNLFHTEPAAKLAAKLAEVSGLVNCFFANSGAEANEGMIKMARKYSKDKYGEGRFTIVSLNRSFHGRTITTLAACGQESLHQHFDPFTPGFVHVPPGDIEALKGLGDEVCAVLIEPIQGEGGVYPLEASYVQAVADLCQERDWLLLVDEVQTGIGRTGKWFGFQHFEGVLPDAISFAKGVGGGLPIGGFLAGEKLKDTLGYGDHGSTYGGNPVACAAALCTLQIIEEQLASIPEKGLVLKEGLLGIAGLTEARGLGLMWGVTVDPDLATPRDLVGLLLESGLVALSAGKDALRLMPPLTVSLEEIKEGLAVIEKIMNLLGGKRHETFIENGRLDQKRYYENLEPGGSNEVQSKK